MKHFLAVSDLSSQCRGDPLRTCDGRSLGKSEAVSRAADGIEGSPLPGMEEFV